MSARPRCSARPNSHLRLAVPCSSSSEHAAREPRTGRFAYLAALVEEILEHPYGWSSSASGSCTSHQSSLWHWRPEVKRDWERRAAVGVVARNVVGLTR